jgi:predicted transcriptional regulator
VHHITRPPDPLEEIMPRTPKDVTDAELAVLREVWDAGPVTIRQITDRLYAGGGPSHYATVQKLLDRLEAKGCVSHRMNGRAKAFTAVVDRDELIGRRLRETADKLCEGSLTPLLTQLVRSADLDAADLEHLRDLVEELATGQTRRRRKGR